MSLVRKLYSFLPFAVLHLFFLSLTGLSCWDTSFARDTLPDRGLQIRISLGALSGRPVNFRILQVLSYFHDERSSGDT